MIVPLAAILVLGAGSWLFRAGFIVFPAGRIIAVRLDPWLAHARPAVLAALLASLSMRQSTLPEFEALPYAAGLLVSAAVGAATRNLAYGFVAGLTVIIAVGELAGL